MTDLLLRTYISAHTNLSGARDSLIERSKDQSGAEAVQVVMIMGIMAVIVLGVMTIVGGGITTLTHTVEGCISKITGATTTYTCSWNGGSDVTTPH